MQHPINLLASISKRYIYILYSQTHNDISLQKPLFNWHVSKNITFKNATDYYLMYHTHFNIAQARIVLGNALLYW